MRGFRAALAIGGKLGTQHNIYKTRPAFEGIAGRLRLMYFRDLYFYKKTRGKCAKYTIVEKKRKVPVFECVRIYLNAKLLFFAIHFLKLFRATGNLTF